MFLPPMIPIVDIYNNRPREIDLHEQYKDSVCPDENVRLKNFEWDHEDYFCSSDHEFDFMTEATHQQLLDDLMECYSRKTEGAWYHRFFAR